MINKFYLAVTIFCATVFYLVACAPASQSIQASKTFYSEFPVDVCYNDGSPMIFQMIYMDSSNTLALPYINKDGDYVLRVYQGTNNFSTYYTLNLHSGELCSRRTQ